MFFNFDIIFKKVSVCLELIISVVFVVLEEDDENMIWAVLFDKYHFPTDSNVSIFLEAKWCLMWNHLVSSYQPTHLPLH